MERYQFLKTQFDKLLCSLFLLITMALVFVAVKTGNRDYFIFATGSFTTFSGSLLNMMRGSAPKPPELPETPPEQAKAAAAGAPS